MEFNFSDISDDGLRTSAINRYVKRINQYNGRCPADEVDDLRVRIVKFYLRVEKVIIKWEI